MHAPRILTASLLSAAVLAGTAGAASAATVGPTGPRLETTRARCVSEIDRRITALDSFETRISGSTRLTTDQKTSINGNLDAVEANLDNVNRPAVVTAVGPASLANACSAIYTDNRVFAVVLPQLVNVARGDLLGNGVDKIGTAAANKAAGGADVSAVTAELESASGHLATAMASNASVTVAGFNADPAAAKATFEATGNELMSALVDVIQAKQALDALS